MTNDELVYTFCFLVGVYFAVVLGVAAMRKLRPPSPGEMVATAYHEELYGFEDEELNPSESFSASPSRRHVARTREAAPIQVVDDLPPVHGEPPVVEPARTTSTSR